MTHKLCVILCFTDGKKSMNQALKETWSLENYFIQEVDFLRKTKIFLRPNHSIGHFVGD